MVNRDHTTIGFLDPLVINPTLAVLEIEIAVGDVGV